MGTSLSNGHLSPIFFFILEILAILFSQRKNAEELKENLEKVVVPLFCKSFVGAEDNKKQKLTKVKLVKLDLTIV